MHSNRIIIPFVITGIAVAALGMAPGRLSAQQSPETAGRPPHWAPVIHRDSDGRRTAAITPFDLKVISSGFYALTRDPGLNPSLLPIQTAFSQAALFHYETDSVKDHWQAPDITRERMAGDCEDIALWLYAELKRFGYEKLRLVIGKYMAGELNYHAWVTYQDADGSDWVLDPILLPKPVNRSDLPSPSYRPFYSFDGRNKFTHQTD